VKLCLDTGHVSYSGGDNLKIIADHPDRIAYVHLKQVDPDVVAKVKEQDLPFGEAVKLGVMVEPPRGVPAMPPILEALDVAADVPLPIATRTLAYLSSCRTPSA
jgi:inosose dehydratase